MRGLNPERGVHVFPVLSLAAKHKKKLNSPIHASTFTNEKAWHFKTVVSAGIVRGFSYGENPELSD